MFNETSENLHFSTQPHSERLSIELKTAMKAQSLGYVTHN